MARSVPIGFFDSGVGGLSVLMEAKKHLPRESFIYYGDSANAPYGPQSPEKILELSLKAASKLATYKIKALVVACNTATSVAINNLRESYEFPIIGMEPAIKPALEKSKKKKVLVMATPLTLKEEKYKNLCDKYNGEEKIKSLVCPDLATKVEKGYYSGKRMENYLASLLQDIELTHYETIVLGCTHYTFLRDSLAKIIPNNIKIIDGNEGTVFNLKRILQNQLLENTEKDGEIVLLTSGNEKKFEKQCYQLMEHYQNLY